MTASTDQKAESTQSESNKAGFVKSVFLAHPESVGETYFEHMRAALGFSGTLIWIGLAAAVHAVFPNFCQKTASKRIAELNAELQARSSHDSCDK